MAKTLTLNCPGTGPWEIEMDDCIGNSLEYINANTNYLACGVKNITDQAKATGLFVPVNYATKSNANVIIGTWNTNGTTAQNQPWWSGIQTFTFPTTVPENWVGALVAVRANTNAVRNNQQSVYFYKNTEQDDVDPPSTSTNSSNITEAQRTAINHSYRKIEMDPTEGDNNGGYEAETDVTFVVYPNTTNRQLKWFWVDHKNINLALSEEPYYYLKMYLLGYYVSVD
jgi:hypothetical protein